MATVDKIEDLLGEFGLSLVNDTRSSLKKKLDARARANNGRIRDKTNLWASVDHKVGYGSGKLTFVLTMNDYWAVVNDGRKKAPVSKEGQSKLSEWSGVSGLAEKIRISDLAKRKENQAKSKLKKKKSLKKMPFDRAKKSAAFLVARKLKNKVIEPTNFFDEVIEDGRLKELETKLTELIKNEIIIEIRNGFNG